MDYENITRLEMDVTAFDTGVPQRNSTAHLVISVVNVNDMTPEFDQVRREGMSKLLKVLQKREG